MDTRRANSSVFAIVVLLLVIAGVLYLFWQNQQTTPPAANDVVRDPADNAATSLETPAPDSDGTALEMVVEGESTVEGETVAETE